MNRDSGVGYSNCEVDTVGLWSKLPVNAKNKWLQARRHPYAVDATRATSEFGAFLANSMVSRRSSRLPRFANFRSTRRNVEEAREKSILRWQSYRLERDASTLPGRS